MTESINPPLNMDINGTKLPSNQTSDAAFQCKGFIYHQHIVPILYFMMFPVSLLLNGVAAWVSLSLKSTSSFMVYLKNVIAADMLMTLIMPIDATAELYEHLRTVLILSCYTSPLFYSAQYTCITLLGLISLDRFFKIVMPGSLSLAHNLAFSKVLSAFVWVVIFFCTALPNIVLSNKPIVDLEKIQSCMDLKEQPGLEFHEKVIIYLNGYFWFVSVVIATCYICIANKVIQSYRKSGSKNNQGKQRIKLRVFLVVVVFFLSFGPYHLVRIPYTAQQVNITAENYCHYIIGKFFKEFSLWFATTNICMNPLLYIFLCHEFKVKLMAMMEKLFESWPFTLESAPGQCRLQSA